MIYDRLENIGKYFEPDSPFYKALEFIRDFDRSRPDGKYETETGSIRGAISSYATSPAGERRFEAHWKYADVQVLLAGEERLDVSLVQNLKPVTEYDAEKDVIFLKAPPEFSSLAMKPGYFAVVHPPDAHRPGCDLEGGRLVRKIVMKVPVE